MEFYLLKFFCGFFLFQLHTAIITVANLKYTVKLSLEQSRVNFGSDVCLQCSIEGEKPPTGTWQFYRDLDKVAGNGDIKPSLSQKYTVFDSDFKSTLVIRNFTEEDLVTMRCSYGAEQAKYTFVLNETVYTYLPVINDVNITYEERALKDGYKSIRVTMFLKKVYPSPYCWISLMEKSITFTIHKSSTKNGLFESIFEEQFITRVCEDQFAVNCNIGVQKNFLIHNMYNTTSVNCSGTSFIDHSQSEYGVTVVIGCFSALLTLILITFVMLNMKEAIKKYCQEKMCSGKFVWQVFYTTSGSSFLYGYNLSIVNLAAQNFGLYNDQWTYFVSLYAFSGFVGMLVMSIVIHVVEDVNNSTIRYTLIIANIIGVLASVFAFVLTEEHIFELMITHRLLMGLSNGPSLYAALQVLKKRAPDTMKNTVHVSSLYQLSITLGILIGNVLSLKKFLGSPEYWRWLFGLPIVPSLLSLVGIFYDWYKPEEKKLDTDSYPICKFERTADGIGVCSISNTDSSPICKNKRTADRVYKSSISNKGFLQRMINAGRPYLVACLLHVCQQICGINIITCYSSSIFSTLGVGTDQMEVAVCGTSVNNLIITAISVVFMVNKFCRKKMLILPLFIMVLSLSGLPLVLNNVKPETRGEFAAKGTIAINLYVMGFALSLGPLPYIMIEKKESQRTSSIAMTLNWFGNFVVLLSFPFIKTPVKGFAYVIYAIVVLIMFISIIVMNEFVPEAHNSSEDDNADCSIDNAKVVIAI